MEKTINEARADYGLPPIDIADALVIADELCGDMTNELTEELARKSEEIEKLKYDLQKREAYCADLEKRNQELSACAGK